MSKILKADDWLGLTAGLPAVGNKVKLLNKDKEVSRWGGCTEPRMLIIGAEYVIEDVEVHSWHTKLRLQGVEGKFNSAHFELLEVQE